MSCIWRQSQTNPECEKWPWTDPCSKLLQRCAAWGEPTSLPQFLFLSFCLRPLGRSWAPRIMLLLLLLLLLLFTCWAPCLLASPNISQVHQCVFKPCYVKNRWSNCNVYSGKCKHMRCHTMNTFFHGSTFSDYETGSEMCTDHLKVASFYWTGRSWFRSWPLPYSIWCYYPSMVYTSYILYSKLIGGRGHLPQICKSLYSS